MKDDLFNDEPDCQTCRCRKVVEGEERFNRNHKAKELEALRVLRRLSPADALIFFGTVYLELSGAELRETFKMSKASVWRKYQRAVAGLEELHAESEEI